MFFIHKLKDSTQEFKNISEYLVAWYIGFEANGGVKRNGIIRIILYLAHKRTCNILKLCMLIIDPTIAFKSYTTKLCHIENIFICLLNIVAS